VAPETVVIGRTAAIAVTAVVAETAAGEVTVVAAVQAESAVARRPRAVRVAHVLHQPTTTTTSREKASRWAGSGRRLGPHRLFTLFCNALSCEAEWQ